MILRYVNVRVLVDGGYTEWSSWGRCSKPCGGGIRNKTRSCTNPTPQHGGRTCVDQGLGSNIESETCYTNFCPSTYQ